MALPVLVAKFEEIPEAQRGFYVKQEDGSAILDTDDGAFKKKINEFRETNITLRKRDEKATALEKEMEKYKGIDPEKYAKAMEALKVIEDDEEGKLIKEGKLDKVIEARVAKMKGDYDSQIQALLEDNKAKSSREQTYKKKLEELIIDVEIQKAVNGVGVVKKGAMEDVLNRARQQFKIDESSNMIPVKPDGSVAYSKDGTSPLTAGEWASELLQNADHFFDSSKGGGAGGGQKGDGAAKDGKMIPNESGAIIRNLKDVASGKTKVHMPTGVTA